MPPRQRLILRSLTLALALGVGPNAALSAQWPVAIAPGVRVRARLPEAQYQADGRRGHRLRGRVTALTSDTLYLAVTDSVGPLAVPRHLIERLDYSRGVPSRAVSGLTRGLLLGAAFAVSTVLLNEADDGAGRASAGTAALVGGGFGFATGAVYGALYPRERWKSARLGASIPIPR
jgi:hypothetical protein